MFNFSVSICFQLVVMVHITISSVIDIIEYFYNGVLENVLGFVDIFYIPQTGTHPLPSIHPKERFLRTRVSILAKLNQGQEFFHG